MVGKSALKPSLAILTKDLPISDAVAISGQTDKYVQAARAPSYEPFASRLCTEDYSPGTKRQKIHTLETQATVTLARSWFGNKSGQKTADVSYCYLTKDVFYEEKYRANFSTVVAEIARLATEKPDKDYLFAKRCRFGENLRNYRQYGEHCRTLPASKDDGIPDEDEGMTSTSSTCSSSSSSSQNSDCEGWLRPLSVRTFWDTIAYDRKTKSGIRVWFVDRRTCEPCRELPMYENRLRLATERLDKARSEGAAGIAQLEKAHGDIVTKLEKLHRHASWLATQRPFIENIQKQLGWGELPRTCQVIQDFWKVYASDSSAVKSLVCTIFRNVEPDQVPPSLPHTSSHTTFSFTRPLAQNGRHPHPLTIVCAGLW